MAMSENKSKNSNHKVKNSFGGGSKKPPFNRKKFGGKGKGGGNSSGRNDRRRDNRGRKPDYDKQEKNNNGEYIIYGKHPVIEALKNESREKIKLIASKNSLNWLKGAVGEEIIKKVEVELCEPNKIERIVGKNADGSKILHQGLALKTKQLNHYNYVNFQALNKIVALDNISDPHNVGAIIRSAKAFGFDGVLTAEKNSPEESATICKTSAGVIEKLPYKRVTSLTNVLEELKEAEFKIYGLDSDTADEVNDSKFKTDKLVLVVGSEGRGLSPHIKRLCDNILKIRISDEVESLNASVACAVAMNSLT